jgi:hypothetical protein
MTKRWVIIAVLAVAVAALAGASFGLAHTVLSRRAPAQSAASITEVPTAPVRVSAPTAVTTMTVTAEGIAPGHGYTCPDGVTIPSFVDHVVCDNSLRGGLTFASVSSFTSSDLDYDNDGNLTSLSWNSPTQNIGCVTDDEGGRSWGWSCMIGAHNWSITGHDGDDERGMTLESCSLSDPVTFSWQQDSEVYVSCDSDELLLNPEGTAVLPYDMVLELHGGACLSQAQGVTCWATEGGDGLVGKSHGFFISPSRYAIW